MTLFDHFIAVKFLVYHQNKRDIFDASTVFSGCRSIHIFSIIEYFRKNVNVACIIVRYNTRYLHR